MSGHGDGSVDDRRVKVAWVVVGLLALGTALLLAPRLVDGSEELPLPLPVTELDGVRGTPTPTATTTEATEEPTPSPSPTEDEVDEEALAEARASTTAWPALAEWDRVDPDTQNIGWFLGGTGRGVVVAAFNDPEELWNSVVPDLRNELLTEWVASQIEPVDQRFRGKPFADEFESGVVGWWTNAGSGGRGYMRAAYAFYVTADGQDRMRFWPIMIDPGFLPQGFVDAEITSVGPAVDLALDEFNTIDEANELLNDGWSEWFEAQPIRYEAVDPPEGDR